MKMLSPVVGGWYKDLQTSALFEVVAWDPSNLCIETQYLDGEVTEYELDTWRQLLLERAEGYRSQTVNQAEGEASRFKSVYAEYAKAPEVTRKRLYLETIEKVYSGVNKVILDENSGGSGVVPYLPLSELTKPGGTK